MSVEVLNCPACGAQIDIEGAEEFFRCKFCGNTLRIRKRNVNDDGSVTVTDPATGMILGTVRIPFGYQVSGKIMPQISSYSYPFGVGITGHNNSGTMISYFIGESYCDRSKCPILSSIYSKGIEQISHIHYRNFTEIRQYLDFYISQYATSIKASKIEFIEERPMPLYEPLQKIEALENFKCKVEFEKQRSGNASAAKNLDFYLEGVCRVYRMIVNNKEYRVALATVLEAWKYLMMLPGGGMDNVGSIFGGLFGSLGGMFSNQSPQTNQQSMVGGFGTMPANGVIEWQSDGLFLLQSLPGEFEETFRGAYTDFCSTLRVDQGVKEKMFQMQTQILQDIAAHGQQQVDAMNRQFQSWQQIHATQQAAFDSYNKAWWSRNNAADAARRASYQSSLASSGNRSTNGFSEAIRGVNTYVREDGTEIELSVAYDRGFTNASGDIIGTRGSANPGTGWTEMDRK